MQAIGGGSAVQGGYYLSKANWEIFPVERDGERLPGTPADHYVKIPLAAVLVVMPVLGGLMVVFLPFIGLALAAQAAVKPLTALFQRSAQDLAATVTPGWAPGAAHFTGKANEADAERVTRKSGIDAELDRLAAEIAERRGLAPRA
jgi:hypothetical protein